MAFGEQKDLDFFSSLQKLILLSDTVLFLVWLPFSIAAGGSWRLGVDPCPVAQVPSVKCCAMLHAVDLRTGPLVSTPQTGMGLNNPLE